MATPSSPTTLDFLEFSQLAYDLTDTVPLAKVPIPSGYTFLYSTTYPSSLMTAVAFINTATNQIVISYRGSTFTDFYHDWIVADLAHIGPGIVSQDFMDALNFAQNLKTDPEYSSATFYVTGHSLGGAEAEYVGAKLGFSGTTFAAPGVANMLPASVASTANITNFVNQYDPVGNYTATIAGVGPGAHVGPPANTIVLPAKGNYSAAFAAGVLEFGLVGGALIDVGAAASAYHPLGAYASALLAGGYINVNPIALASSSEPINLTTLYPNIQNVVNGTEPGGLLTQSGTVTVATSAGNVNILVAEVASPSGGLAFDSSILTSTSSVSQAVSIDPTGSITSDQTTLDGLVVQSSLADPAAVNIAANGAILVGIPTQQTGDEVTLVANPDGSDNVMVGGDASSSSLSSIELADDGGTGDTLSVVDTTSGTVDLTLSIQPGDTAEISSDPAISDASQDFAFTGAAETLKLDAPASFTGTISNFEAGDTIDLAGVSASSAALVGTLASGVLTVQESGGGAVPLNLGSLLKYYGDAFLVAPDGLGGTDITVFADSSTVKFNGTGEILIVPTPLSLTGTIDNFQVGDTIDLSKLSTSSVYITDSNLLSYQAFAFITLDPNQSFQGYQALDTSDGNGGTDITLAQLPAPHTYIYNYTGNDFTGSRFGNNQVFPFLEGNVQALFTVSNMPANYTGTVAFLAQKPDESIDDIQPYITSWSTTAYGETISESVTGAAGTVLEFKNGVITDWYFSASTTVSPGLDLSSGDLGVNNGSFDDTAILMVTKSGLQNGFTTEEGSWSSGEVACFHEGTRLLMQHGEIPVQDLSIGAHVLTQAGLARRVTWLGHRRIDCGKHPKPADVWPVRICPGAFGPGLPVRDLLLSPDHAVFAEGVLIPVKYLINGATIVQEPRDAVTYWHVELERHDVILAEGLPCESYLDTGNRDAFANGGSATQLHPDFVSAGGEAIWEATACAPLRIEGEAVARVIARLRRRANKEAGHREASGSRRRRLPHRAAKCDLGRLLQPDWYLAENPDVAAVGMDAVQHYAGWGRAEGRLPCPEVELIRGLGLIDPGLVIFSMADVVAAGVDPIEHFCEGGWRERRRPNPYFDTGWYLDTHDVPAGMNPLLHYVLTGESVPPGRHFDPVWYRRRYALPCKVSPLAHYLAHRRTQRVSPLPSFNVAAYVRAHDDTLRPDRDAYAHYLAIGQFTTADTGQVDRAAA